MVTKVGLLAYAIATTAMVLYVSLSYSLSVPYLLLQPVAVAGAWTSVWAWHRGRWFLASGCIATTLSAAWGYLYFGPLVGMALMAVGVKRGVRARGVRSEARRATS